MVAPCNASSSDLGILVGPHLHGFKSVLLVGLWLEWSIIEGPLMSRWSASWEVMRGVVKEESFLKKNVVGYQALTAGGSESTQRFLSCSFICVSGAVLNRPLYSLFRGRSHSGSRMVDKVWGERTECFRM